MDNKINRLFSEFGQSLWYDNIARDLLESGEIRNLVENGVRGLTSNPSIFEQAITGSDIYDTQIAALAAEGKSAVDIYENLAVTDIRAAADILRAVYDGSGGMDGFVSLEVSPLLANDTDGTLSEAKRLWAWVDRPNLMIKIPATDAGLPAITEAISSGINVNVTLIFSIAMYARVMDAYIAGLTQRASRGEDISRIASVASFFISRVDSLVDSLLDDRIAEAAGETVEKLEALKGMAGIANAKFAYQLYRQKFSGDTFNALAGAKPQHQRPLWASTSTKNPAYSDVLYVDNLIGPNTVNTAPPQTIEAFKDHGTLAATLEADLEGSEKALEGLSQVGIDMEAVTDQLLTEGVAKFEKPFNTLVAAVKAKAASLA